MRHQRLLTVFFRLLRTASLKELREVATVAISVGGSEGRIEEPFDVSVVVRFRVVDNREEIESRADRATERMLPVSESRVDPRGAEVGPVCLDVMPLELDGGVVPD